jgi:hypothetical protein
VCAPEREKLVKFDQGGELPLRFLALAIEVGNRRTSDAVCYRTPLTGSSRCSKLDRSLSRARGDGAADSQPPRNAAAVVVVA